MANVFPRVAEAMTIFAAICGCLFPLIHMEGPGLRYFIHYPSCHLIWPNFMSPLVWDVFAVSTYLTVSLVFWYVGLIPDFATLRDRATNKIKKTHLFQFSALVGGIQTGTGSITKKFI